MKTIEALRNQVRLLSKSELLKQARELAAEERKIRAAFLVYLERIQDLGLHLEQPYGSLHEFMVKELHFSEGAAQRRIQALYLMKSVPETKDAIEKGKISLSSASQLQTFFRAEAKLKGKPVEPEKKQALFQAIQGKSRRETERLLAAISPQAMLPPENEKALTEKLSQLTVVLESSVVKELDRLRELLAHHDKSGPAPQSYGELIAYLTRTTLKRVDPELKETKAKKISARKIRAKKVGAKKIETLAERPSTPPAVKPCVEVKEGEADVKVEAEVEAEVKVEAAASTPPPENRENRRTIPAALEREIRARDQNQCTWRNTETGKRCASRFALEIDHVIAFAFGGPTTLDNLRLLCRAHHRYVTIQTFGAEKMTGFGPKLGVFRSE